MFFQCEWCGIKFYTVCSCLMNKLKNIFQIIILKSQEKLTHLGIWKPWIKNYVLTFLKFTVCTQRSAIFRRKRKFLKTILYCCIKLLHLYVHALEAYICWSYSLITELHFIHENSWVQNWQIKWGTSNACNLNLWACLKSEKEWGLCKSWTCFAESYRLIFFN